MRVNIAVVWLVALPALLAAHEGSFAKKHVLTKLTKGVFKGTSKQDAPVPENIDTVVHHKDAGAGYRAGSPLYERQQHGHVEAPRVASLDDRNRAPILQGPRHWPAASSRAAPAPAPREEPVFTAPALPKVETESHGSPTWVWILIIVLVVLQILLAGVCLWAHSKYRKKSPQAPYEPRGSAMRPPGTVGSIPQTQGIVVGLPTPGMRSSAPVMRMNSGESPGRGESGRSRSPQDFGLQPPSMTYSPRRGLVGPPSPTGGGPPSQPVQTMPPDPNASAAGPYSQRSWHMPGSWTPPAGGGRP